VGRPTRAHARASIFGARPLDSHADPRPEHRAREHAIGARSLWHQASIRPWISLMGLSAKHRASARANVCSVRLARCSSRGFRCAMISYERSPSRSTTRDWRPSCSGPSSETSRCSPSRSPNATPSCGHSPTRHPRSRNSVQCSCRSTFGGGEQGYSSVRRRCQFRARKLAVARGFDAVSLTRTPRYLPNPS